MEDRRAQSFVRLKVLSMGDGGAGKSCLIKRFCEQKFVPRYLATIGVDFGVKSVVVDGRELKVNFWDLSGHAEFQDVRNEFYKDTQAALLVFDVTSRQSFVALESWLREAAQFGARDFRGVVCANKIDLGKRRTVPEAEARRWAEARGLGYWEVSAKSGEGVMELFDHLFRALAADAQAPLV